MFTRYSVLLLLLLLLLVVVVVVWWWWWWYGGGGGVRVVPLSLSFSLPLLLSVLMLLL